MASGTGYWGWEDACDVLTESLRTNGLFHWGEIRDTVGEEAYGTMQWLRGDSRVWVVDHADIAPKPRRSMVDYARVDGAELGRPSSQLATIGAPEPVTPHSGDVPGHTCGMTDIDTMDYELAHHVHHRTLASVNDWFVRDLMVSFYDRIALDIERQIQKQVGRAHDEEFAFVGKGNSGTGTVATEAREPMGTNAITQAGIGVARSNPQVPFPHGLVCMISPEQAMQLFGNSSAKMENMSAGGISLVTSPAVKFGGSQNRFMNVVAANGSIRVALSGIEVDAVRQNAGTVIRARYSMGVRVEPHLAARIFSYRN